MRTREKTLWAWLKRAEDQILERYLLHWQRIENSVGVGTSDVEGCYIGRSFIAELKSVPRAKKIRTELKKEQAMHIEARINAGGRAWIFIQVDGEKRYLIWGAHAFELLSPITEARLEELSVTMIEGTAKEVLEVMSGKEYGRRN